MNQDNLKSLKTVFYIYWMARVPQLNEMEAIDHLEWELRNHRYTPQLVQCRVSFSTKRKLRAFLKEKGIKADWDSSTTQKSGTVPLPSGLEE